MSDLAEIPIPLTDGGFAYVKFPRKGLTHQDAERILAVVRTLVVEPVDVFFGDVDTSNYDGTFDNAGEGTFDNAGEEASDE